jgi:cell division protease FtsH
MLRAIVTVAAPILMALSIGLAVSLGVGSSAIAEDGGAWGMAAYTPPLVPVKPPEQDVAYSDFIAEVDQGAVRQVVIAEHTLSAELVDGRRLRSTSPEDPSLVTRLLNHHVKLTVAPEAGPSPWVQFLTAGLPLLIVVGVTVYLVMSSRRQGGSGPPALGIGQSQAKRVAEDAPRFTFEDVAGIDEAEQELREVVDFLKAPEKFQRLGGKMPRGCLLVGPPGTGKTLLARAVAGEAGVPFFTMAGSEFVEMYVGVGAGRVRALFERAKKDAPCIIFIDEIDAVGRHRGAGLGGGNDERDQTLNQLLVEMDGFQANAGVVVIAATNRPDVLDPALLRPGRFDRQVVVSPPDVAGREKILKVHLRSTPQAADVDIRVIARGTPGFSGADLANLVNEAALLAARRGADHISGAELEEAKDKVMMGAERRSLVMTETERETTAYHEAGHALVAVHSPGHDPLHKVTIVPRGRALGVTMSLPERDRYGFDRRELEAKIAMMFGGRVAEELVFGAERVTTGASDDIRQATGLAQRMVTEFGFSSRLGPLLYSAQQQEGFLGQGGGGRLNVSDATARIIDEEVRRIVEEGEARARAILTANLDDLRRLASALLEHETLTGAEICSLMAVQSCAADLAGQGHAPRGTAPPTLKNCSGQMNAAAADIAFVPTVLVPGLTPSNGRPHLRGPRRSHRSKTATPGRVLPSIHSRKAPPAVDT